MQPPHPFPFPFLGPAGGALGDAGNTKMHPPGRKVAVVAGSGQARPSSLELRILRMGVGHCRSCWRPSHSYLSGWRESHQRGRSRVWGSGLWV